MSKALFLDVDGVLVTPESRPIGDQLDRGCLGQLKRIYDIDPDIEIVLTSSWRLKHLMESRHALYKALAALGIDWRGRATSNFGNKVTLERPLIGRGNEIQAWLASHPFIKTYAIIDDQDVLAESTPEVARKHKRNFFRTAEHYGLTAEIADQIIKHLG